MVSEIILEALVKIGNHEKVIAACEPNIMQPQLLTTWMVKRTLYSLLLFKKEMDELPRANKARTRTVRKKE